MMASTRRLQMLLWTLYLVSLPASYPILPDRVGDAGKEIDKLAYIGLMLFASWPLPWLMCGSMAGWVRRHPDMLSIPYKPYWLAPERAELSWARLDRQLLATGWLIWLMLAGLHYQACARHMSTWPYLPDEFTVMTLGALVSLVLIGLWRQVRSWQVPRADWVAFQSRAGTLSQGRGGERPWQRKRTTKPVVTPLGRDHGQPR